MASPSDPRAEGLKFGDLFPEHTAQFAVGVPAALARVENEGTRGCLEQTPRPESWGLVRRGGLWIMRARVNDGATPCRGMFQDADIPGAPAPPRITGPVGTTSLAVRKLVTGARDWMSSPGGDLLAVVLARTVEVFRVEDGKTVQPAVLSVPVAEGESVVSVQWAPPDAVARWDAEIRAMAAGPVR